MTISRDSMLGRIIDVVMGQAVTVGVLGILYLLAGAGHADQAQRDIVALRTDNVTLRSDMKAGFAEVQISIANLPSVNAELVQMGRRLDADDKRNEAQSRRLDEIWQVTIANQADVANLIRGTNTPVGSAGRRP